MPHEEEPLSTAIVGLGGIGLRYDLEKPPERVTTHTRACQMHPHVRLVAGIDPNRAARDLFERTAQSPAFADFDAAGEIAAGEILDDVDLFIVSTPTSCRLSVVRRCLERRPRALLVEKPIAETAAEGEAIVELCRRQNVILAVNYFRRFLPLYGKLGEDIREGRLGKPLYASCLYTGGLLNNGSHAIDLFLDWFGAPYHVSRLCDRAAEAAQPDGGHNQQGSFLLDYRKFPVLLRELSSPFGLFEIDMICDRGRLKLENFGEDFRLFVSGPDPYFAGFRRLLIADETQHAEEMFKYQWHVLDAVVSSVRGGAAVPSNGDTALKVLKVCRELLDEPARLHRVA